jgi:RNA polymerase sigma factor (sigma-70 family)
MSASPGDDVLRHLRRAALRPDGADLSDGQLLDCFLRRRDEAAFAALVRRHGPMVWGVCLRTLRNHHDAEDAFQATFLVLVRKAASIVPREQVAGWLHGVAYHTALKARAAAARRRLKERQPTAMTRSTADPHDRWEELQPLLDRELSRLPEKYRIPVVLCDLEGKTRKEAARQLGWPEGTLSGRLARARALLARRLARHGLALSGGALALLLADEAAIAAVPPAVLRETIRAGGVWATDTAGGISARVLILTNGVLRAMLLSKLKIATGVVMVAGLLGMGGGLLGPIPGTGTRTEQVVRAAEPPQPPDRPRDADRTRHQVDNPPRATDQGTWRLDFAFKDPRLLPIEVPGVGKKTVWYLWYQVVNDTGEERTFIPDFDLVTFNPDGSHHDVVLPRGLFDRIRRAEDAAGLLDLKNSVTIARDPIPASKTKGPTGRVAGIATWDDVPPDLTRFTIFVSGLTNLWSTDGDGIVRRKTLQLNFKRAGDEVEFVPPAQWVHRRERLKTREPAEDFLEQARKRQRFEQELRQQQKDDLQKQLRDTVLKLQDSITDRDRTQQRLRTLEATIKELQARREELRKQLLRPEKEDP